MAQTIDEPPKQRWPVVAPLINAVALHIGDVPIRLAAQATLHRRRGVVLKAGTVPTIRSSGHANIMHDASHVIREPSGS
jgi:hypothetical protein